jgi:putative membrane protein
MMMNKTSKVLCAAAIGFAAMMTTVNARAAVTGEDKKFLATASQGGMNEIKLSQLAEKQATSPEVKAFAHKMVVEHEALASQMKPFADAWGIEAPSGPDADHQGELDKLSGLSGADFDKEYMNAMVKDHHDALNLFQHEAATTTDAKFKRAVMRGESMVAAHTHMADSLLPKV